MLSRERKKQNWKVYFWPLVLDGHDDVQTTYCRNTTVTTTNGINHFKVILGLRSKREEMWSLRWWG